MVVLLGLAFVPIVLKVFIGDVEKNKRNKKNFLIWCGIIITMFLGLRHYAVGTTDTEVYCMLYRRAANYGSLTNFLNKHGVLNVPFILSESLFYIYVWISSRFISNPQFLIFSSTAFVTFSVMRFIYKHSENALISITMYICLGLMTFNLNGMRQAIAMAICLFAYGYAKDKQFIPFALIVLIAVLVHKTAIFFGVVYFISFLKFDFKSFMIFAIAVILFILFADNLIATFDSIADKNYSDGEVFEAGGYVTVLIYALTILFTLVVAGKSLSSKDFIFVFYITLLGASFYLARYFIIQIYERMSYYFFYATILLLPKAINRIEETERPILTLIVIGFAMALFCYRLYGSLFQNFMFFWG